VSIIDQIRLDSHNSPPSQVKRDNQTSPQQIPSWGSSISKDPHDGIGNVLPVHKVTLGQFYMDANEVTVRVEIAMGEIALNVLQAILTDKLPTSTRQLANYSDSFNPETWILFQLS